MKSMKKTPYDYCGFRLSRVKEPHFRHILLLLGWVGYLLLYFLTENLIPPESCHVIHCRLDDLIPFCEVFVVAYCFWFVYLIGSLLYFFIYDIPSFKGLQVFIIVTQIVAMACYILYPSRQDLRPEVFPRENVFTWVLSFIYHFDTSTGVCPSLHVAYSLGIASTWLKYRDASVPFKVFVVIAAVLICMSVSFVKQHSAVDILAALPVALLAEIIAYGKSWWRPRLGRKTGAAV